MVLYYNMISFKHLFLLLILYGQTSCSKNSQRNVEKGYKNANRVSQEFDITIFKQFILEEYYPCHEELYQNITGKYKNAITLNVERVNTSNTIVIYNSSDSLFVYPFNFNCKSLKDSLLANGIISKKDAIQKAIKKGFVFTKESIINLDFANQSNFENLTNETKKRKLPSIYDNYKTKEKKILSWIILNKSQRNSQVAYVEAIIGETIMIEALDPSHF